MPFRLWPKHGPLSAYTFQNQPWFYYISCEPAISFRGNRQPGETSASVQQPRARRHVAVFFVRAPPWKQPKCPPREEQITGHDVFRQRDALELWQESKMTIRQCRAKGVRRAGMLVARFYSWRSATRQSKSKRSEEGLSFGPMSVERGRGITSLGDGCWQWPRS